MELNADGREITADTDREPGPRVENGRLKATDDSMHMLERGHRAYMHLAPERKRRRRNRDYVYGDQWQEQMTDPDTGQQIKEEEYIRSQNRIPWSVNRLLPVVRHAKGQLRQNQGDRAAYARNKRDDEQANAMTELLRQARSINKLDAIEADNFQEHIIGGRSAFRVGYKHWSRYDRSEVLVQPINMLRMIWNADATDRRGLDQRLVGMIHDMTLADVVESFAPRDPKLAKSIQAHYGNKKAHSYSDNIPFGREGMDALQYYHPTNSRMCRVVELWVQKPSWTHLVHDYETGQTYDAGREVTDAELEQVNRQRRQAGQQEVKYHPRYEKVWYGYYLTPEGGVLWEGPTPYEHGEHPFVIGWADQMDGEALGLIDELVDQQRLYNRMIQQMDLAMSTAARGVMMIPEEMIPEGQDPEDFASEYSKVNGVLVYKATGKENGRKPDPSFKPEQVYNRSFPAQSFDWLAQLKGDMEDASGMTGPMMGETPKSGTPAALYHQQVLQAQTNTMDLFETYLETLHDLDIKMLQTALQYYEDGRPIKTEGGEVIEFDRQAARDLEFDVEVARVGDTATYRQLFEEDLKEFRANQEITFRQFLETSSHPKARSLLKLIERTNPLAKEGAPKQDDRGQSVPPAIQEALQGMGASPEEIASASPQEMQQALTVAAQNGDRDAAALLKQAA